MSSNFKNSTIQKCLQFFLEFIRKRTTELAEMETLHRTNLRNRQSQQNKFGKQELCGKKTEDVDKLEIKEWLEYYKK